MKGFAKYLTGSALFVTVIFLSASCFAITMEELVDQLKQGTDIQRAELIAKYQGQMIKANGVVAEVKEYDTFDERTDVRARYYQVVAKVQNTAMGTPYQVSIFYNDLNKVSGILKDQKIEKEGPILRMLDERLWFSVWVYDSEIGPKEKVMFGDQGALPKK